ncbi:MAG: cytochrome c biogenesis protein CcsA [Phycisphaerae bacterium]|nr:cytochrome c biogenesis protein CcsA [Phycisphaerae bacterium]
MGWKHLISGFGTAGLLAATALAFLALARRREARRFYSTLAAGLVLIANVAALATGIVAHGPLDAMRDSFASSLLLTGLLVAVGLLAQRIPAMRGLDGVLFLFAGIMQFSAFFQIDRPTTDVTYNPWFISHQVAFALSATCFTVGGAAGAVYLLLYRLLRRKRALSLARRLPPLESLERVGRWMLMIGFPFLTYGVLTGFCQLSRQSDPGPWQWLVDPFIVVTLILWLVYALAVVAVWRLPRMRGPRAAALAAASLCLLVIVFVVLDHLSPLHR